MKRSLSWLLLVVSLLSILGLLVGYLALYDIRHGEVDLHQEWLALEVVFAILFVSNSIAIIAALRDLRPSEQAA